MMRAQSTLSLADQSAFALQIVAAHAGPMVDLHDRHIENFWMALGGASSKKTFTHEAIDTGVLTLHQEATDAAAIDLASDHESMPVSVVVQKDSAPNSTASSPVLSLAAVGKLRFLASAANTRKTLDGAIRMHLERGQ